MTEPNNVHERTGHTIWLTGLSGAGKSTISRALAAKLEASGQHVSVLDGDVLRRGLSSDLGLSPADRTEQARRTAHVAALMSQAGLVAIVALVSPYEQDRHVARQIHSERGLGFFEVWVDTPVSVCAERDPKGLYARHRAGELHGLTGVDAPYEPAVSADMRVAGFDATPEELAERILAAVRGKANADAPQDDAPEVDPPRSAAPEPAAPEPAAPLESVTVSEAGPLVSVLIPSYNTSPYIEACLRSVLDQTHRNLEVVIADDVSTDGTYELLTHVAAADTRVRLLRNETNLGNIANFQQLMGLASGKYVNFVCCDDVLLPESLARKVALLEGQPEVAIAATQKIVIDTQGQPIADRNEYIWTHTPFGSQRGTYVIDGYEAGNSMLVDINNWIGEPTAVMYRNGLLSASDPNVIGSVRPARNVDFVWWLQLMAGSKLGYINEALSCFRHRAGQTSKQAALVPDLTLSWFDIVRGAKNAGYLESPELEVKALARVADHIQSRLPQLLPDHLDRTTAVLGKIAERLQELGGAQPVPA